MVKVVLKNIHTTIPEYYYKKLLEYSDITLKPDDTLKQNNHTGLNSAIVNLIKLVEAKPIIVNVPTIIIFKE